MRWYRHVLRTDEEKFHALNMKVKGKLRRQRLRTRWQQQDWKAVTQMEIRTWEETQEGEEL
jgi:hypothetical protein